MNLLLRKLDGLGRLASDEDIVGVSALGIRRTVAIDLREWRGEIDGRAGRRFDDLDILALTSADYLMERHVELDRIDKATQLSGKLVRLAQRRSS